MENISKKINKMFENLFKTDDNIHPFLKDLKIVHITSPKYRANVKNSIKKL